MAKPSNVLETYLAVYPDTGRATGTLKELLDEHHDRLAALETILGTDAPTPSDEGRVKSRFIQPFGTVRACIDCGGLIAGGPTRCVHCARRLESPAANPPSEERCEPRAVVRWFAEQMERELRENDHKSTWLDETDEWLLGRLREEVTELAGALSEPCVDRGRIRSEAADVANFAMMIADWHGDGIGPRRASLANEQASTPPGAAPHVEADGEEPAEAVVLVSQWNELHSQLAAAERRIAELTSGVPAPSNETVAEHAARCKAMHDEINRGKVRELYRVREILQTHTTAALASTPVTELAEAVCSQLAAAQKREEEQHQRAERAEAKLGELKTMLSRSSSDVEKELRAELTAERERAKQATVLLRELVRAAESGETRDWARAKQFLAAPSEPEEKS